MAGEVSRNLLQEIANDNLSGSVGLLPKVSRLFGEFQADQESEEIPAEVSLEKLWELCRQLLRSQPAMAVLVQMVDRALWASEDEPLPRNKLPSACKAISRYVQEVSDHQQRIAEAFLPMVANSSTLMTHSSSSAVKEAVLALHRSGKDFRLILTESRPMLEGVQFGKLLAQRGVRCTLVVDSMAFSMLPDADCVIVGGDALSEAGLVNKAGTLGLAIAARELGKPFWALVGREKFLPHGIVLDIPDKPSEEVLSEKIPGLSVVNRYFDLTPLPRLTGIVTEQGPISTQALMRGLSQPKPHQMLSRLSRP